MPNYWLYRTIICFVSVCFCLLCRLNHRCFLETPGPQGAPFRSPSHPQAALHVFLTVFGQEDHLGAARCDAKGWVEKHPTKCAKWRFINGGYSFINRYRYRYIYITVSDMFCYVLLLFMSKSHISSWKNPLKNPGYEPPATCGHLPISVWHNLGS